MNTVANPLKGMSLDHRSETLSYPVYPAKTLLASFGKAGSPYYCEPNDTARLRDNAREFQEQRKWL
jgi:hypothetical protein